MHKPFDGFLSKLILLIFLSFSIIASRVHAQTLDKTFGNVGRVVTMLNDSSTANDIAIQSDGKIIAGGSTTISGSSYFALVRYNGDGSLDNSFGSEGKVVTRVKDRCVISSIAIQSDGKILAGGSAYNDGANIFTDSGYTIVRYRMNGSIDSVFGNNGITIIKMANGTGGLKKLLIKPDGKILTAGSVDMATFESTPVLVQLNADGSIDSSFGTDGKMEQHIDNIEKITDMGLAKDGKILVSGQIKNWEYVGDFALIRFLQNGRLDSSFGTDGIVKTDFNNDSLNNLKVENAMGLIVLPDGSIVMAGYNYTSPATFALAKYKVNGFLDSTFGAAGKVTTSVFGLYSFANDILADPSGNLFVSGYAGNNFAIAKYFSTGKPDSSFGKNGIDTTDFFGFSDMAFSSALQTDGKIILAGQAGGNTNYSIALARYTMEPLPLELLNFTANKKGEDCFLEWQTTKEINVDRFEIERSLNGREYSSIGKMKAGLNKYSFTDMKPFNAINYYRIKMIDRDGRFTYSPIRIVSNNNGLTVRIYPIPAKDELNIQIQSDIKEKAEITVTDILGKTVITNSVGLAAGVNIYSINVKQAGKGVYYLKIVTSKATETRKIIVGQ